jgi:hypothetical protein
LHQKLALQALPWCGQQRDVNCPVDADFDFLSAVYLFNSTEASAAWHCAVDTIRWSREIAACRLGWETQPSWLQHRSAAWCG